MACDKTSVLASIASNGEMALSDRGNLLALAAVYGATLTAQQAITLAAQNKLAALSDRQLDQVLLSIIC